MGAGALAAAAGLCMLTSVEARAAGCKTGTAVYERALEEGMVNPNGRPQLEDFIDLVCSMSRMRYVPGDELATRMREVIGEISAPW